MRQVLNSHDTPSPRPEKREKRELRVIRISTTFITPRNPTCPSAQASLGCDPVTTLWPHLNSWVAEWSLIHAKKVEGT